VSPALILAVLGNSKDRGRVRSLTERALRAPKGQKKAPEGAKVRVTGISDCPRIISGKTGIGEGIAEMTMVAHDMPTGLVEYPDIIRSIWHDAPCW